jgi:methionine biosynthesis protein MetW
MIKYDHEGFNPELLKENGLDKIQINMIPNNSRVLEIGCATGFMSEYLRKIKNCYVLGVECDTEMAKLAATRCDILMQGKIDDKAFQNKIDAVVKEKGQFDIVFMSQVIEHIAFPNEVLVKIKDWLTDNGSLVISLPNVAHWRSRLRLLFGVWEYEKYGLFDNTHLRFFTIPGFRRDLENAGYKVVDEGYSMPILTPKVIRAYYIKLFKNLIAFTFVFMAKKR